MLKKLSYLLTYIIYTFSFCASSYAITASEQVGRQERSTLLEAKEKELRKTIDKKKAATEIQEPEPAQPPAVESNEKTMVRQINVTGASFLSEKELLNIIVPFQGKELTLTEMNKVASLITDAYRKKGYVTSRAYLPPQKIENSTLEIRVVEGRMGAINVTGNKYFKARLFTRRIALKPGDPFDYNKLRASLSRINWYQDRSAKAVLLPGKDAGTTDVNLEVKDNLPLHMAVAWDNFGSRYIEKDRYEGILKYNNLLGFDDSLTFQYQTAEAHAYSLSSLRYLIPVTAATEVGFMMAQSKLRLGREFEDVNARGKSKYYSLYTTHEFVNKENVSFSGRLGFDYKDVINFQNNNVTSRDLMRVAKASFNVDISDRFGRTIFDNEIGMGIPDIMGGLDAKDPRASRVGSGGKFVKDTITFLRLQKMPFSSNLLWKNQAQISPYNLTSTEQFQLGGIANLRGYAPAELVGDTGFATTLEWSFPPYLISKNVKVPFSKAMLYDSLRFVSFFDWGTVQLKTPQAGEKKRDTLKDIGVGMRFSLPENFSVQIDIAWPLGKTSTDGNRCHPWFQVSKEF